MGQRHVAKSIVSAASLQVVHGVQYLINPLIILLFCSEMANSFSRPPSTVRFFSADRPYDKLG